MLGGPQTPCLMVILIDLNPPPPPHYFTFRRAWIIQIIIKYYFHATFLQMVAGGLVLNRYSDTQGNMISGF